MTVSQAKGMMGAKSNSQRVAPFRIGHVQERRKYLKLLIYGAYGVGKTFLAGTSGQVPEMRDVLLINAESGDLTLSSSPEVGENVDVVDVYDFKTAARVYEFLKRHCALRDANDEEGLRKLQAWVTGQPEDEVPLRRYHTVIIDSLAEIEAYNMYSLLGVSNNTRLDEDIQSAEWADYKRNNSTILRFVRAFRDLPMHVIMTCPEQYAQDELKRFHYSPHLTGQLSGKVQGFMDMVGYLQAGNPDDKGNVPRRLWVQPAGKFDAKNRFSSYKKPFFDNPTMKDILLAIGLSKMS